MKNAVEIEKLEKKYVNFDLKIDELIIPSGLIVGLIGENGAGKTTLIKSILNIIKKDSGSIKVFDRDSVFDELDIKENVGVILDNTFFPEILSPRDINLIMNDVYKNWDCDLFYKYLNDFGIMDNQILKTMSKGMRKKVEIATALSHHPKLLILDEPTSGLDPIVRADVLDLFLDFIKDEEHTILLSTHITSDLEHVADHIVFIDKGRIVLQESRDVLLDNYGVIKCGIDEFHSIAREDIVSYRKNKYNYEILISDKCKCSRKYKNFVIDKITIEELMIFIIKGVK
jgi:ABC-2 type transport system ATP-binding protein